MSDLGDFLERFYGPDETFRSVQARVRRTQKESSNSATSGRQSRIGRPRRDRKSRGDVTEDLSMWGELPDKVRIEITREREGQTETTLEVVNGLDAWKRFGDGTVEKNTMQQARADGNYRLPTEFQRHFDRRLLRECFAALSMEAIGRCQVAGRDCLKIRAIHLPGTQLWPHWFSFVASEFELAADIDKAVLLSIAGIVDGQPVDTHEVLEVAFDGTFEDALFTYEAREKEVVQPATPVAEHISLDAAAGKASFTLLSP